MRHLSLPFPPHNRPSIALWIGLLLAAPLLAGCLGGAAPSDVFIASARGGVMFEGIDYAAETKTGANAILEVDVNAAENTGKIIATGGFGNRSFVVQSTGFTGSADFHEGGIVGNIWEHGDTGVGNTLWPAMHVLVATWGTGTFRVGETEMVDDYTGSTVWDLHLMITDTGVRDDETGQMRNPDGGLYDPADPGNAQVGTDLEAHLILQSTYPNATKAPINMSVEGSTDLMEREHNFEFEVPIANATIRIEFELDDAPTHLGAYTFRLFGPGGGQPIEAATLAPAPTRDGNKAVIEVQVDEAGTYRAGMSSPTTPGSYSADLLVTFPPKPMYYFFWENVDIEQRIVS